MPKLTRAAIIITAISGVLVFVSKDTGRMLTTEGDLLVWRVPFSRLVIRVPDWVAPIQHLALLSLLVVIALWVSVGMKTMKRSPRTKE